MSEHHLMVVLVTIVGLGVVSQWLAWRVRLPASDCSSKTVPILVLKADGSVRFHSPEVEMEPEAGDTVVHYGPKRPATKPARVPEAVTTG